MLGISIRQINVVSHTVADAQTRVIGQPLWVRCSRAAASSLSTML